MLDVVSYGRRGVGSLSSPERDLILRTARRVPEVMVKVSGGGRNLAGVQRHLQYIDRKGTLDMETDSGVILEAGMERHLLLDWDIDLEERPRARELARAGRKPVKLVHNVIFSMPPGTDPKKVLIAYSTDRERCFHTIVNTGVERLTGDRCCTQVFTTGQARPSGRGF